MEITKYLAEQIELSAVEQTLTKMRDRFSNVEFSYPDNKLRTIINGCCEVASWGFDNYFQEHKTANVKTLVTNLCKFEKNEII